VSQGHRIATAACRRRSVTCIAFSAVFITFVYEQVRLTQQALSGLPTNHLFP